MVERSILFSAPMVRALLDGRKAQTRRAVKTLAPAEAACAGVFWDPGTAHHGIWAWMDDRAPERANGVGEPFRCPYGVPGDTLYVRETFRLPRVVDTLRPAHASDWLPVHYEADGAADPSFFGKTRVSIHMPRWASRLTLRITDVRVERLCSIRGPDAEAEGLKWIAPGVWSVDAANAPVAHADPVIAYLQLWDHINGEGSAARNPWVWAVDFERVASE